MPRPRLFFFLGLGVLLGVALLMWRRSSSPPPPPASLAKPEVHAGSTPQMHPPLELPGDAILKNYALPTTRPQEDLEALAHTLSNLLLLIKGDSPFRMGANEEFAAALRGKNRTQLRFLSDSHRAFNAQGQLIDRWETPLYFHALARDKVDIRSAGPDRQMWTADDLHRHYDGNFLKGEALNPKSLFQEKAPGRSAR